MIGSSNNSRENYLRKCFRTQEKETWVKFHPGLIALRTTGPWCFWPIGRLFSVHASKPELCESPNKPIILPPRSKTTITESCRRKSLSHLAKSETGRHAINAVSSTGRVTKVPGEISGGWVGAYLHPG